MQRRYRHRIVPLQGTPLSKDGHQVLHNCTILVGTGRFKGAKRNFTRIGGSLQAGLQIKKITEKLTTKCSQPGPGKRIGVVIANKDEGVIASKDNGNEAKQHTCRLTSSMPGARMKGEQW